MERSQNTSAGPVQACLHQLRLFFIALQFLTRLPAPAWVGFEPVWLHHAARYFPAAGFVVGVIAATVYALASLVLPPVIAVLLSTIAGVWFTGAFHEDGFADVCDGFGGGYTKDRVLEIMKDSRIGAYGAIGIALMLALKCAALSALPANTAILALLLAHPLSRMAAVALIWRLSYVRDEGKSKPLAEHISTAEFCIAAVSGLLPTVIVWLSGGLAWHGILAGALAAALSTLWLARLFVRRIGGYTGDCLGAIQQVSEVAFYLGLLCIPVR